MTEAFVAFAFVGTYLLVDPMWYLGNMCLANVYFSTIISYARIRPTAAY